MYLTNFLVIAAQMAVYFGAMLALFRSRRLLGIGAFFCALAATQFLETLLAASFYLKMPFDLAFSPGSAILLSGKLAMVLLTYIREDAGTARQPLYGMMLGNVLVFILVATLSLEVLRAPMPQPLDLARLGKFSAMMMWGTLLLVIECLGMFILYERLRAFGLSLFVTLFATLAVALVVDQICYFAALRASFGIPWEAGVGGLLAKLGAAAVYAALLAWYLTRVEGPAPARTRQLRTPGEIWRAMRPGGTAPAAAAPEGRRYDPLTGTFHASQFEPVCGHLLAVTTLTGRPMSLLLMSIDREDGGIDPAALNTVIYRVGEALGEGIRSGDYVVRYRDNAFAILTPGAPHQAAMQVASLLRREIESVLMAGAEPRYALSIGVATTPQDGASVTALLDAAERRVAEARARGPNQVAGVFTG
ncbi:GGDEF domain-containing protein [Xanthobacteraceae bacterium A53D]